MTIGQLRKRLVGQSLQTKNKIFLLRKFTLGLCFPLLFAFYALRYFNTKLDLGLQNFILVPTYFFLSDKIFSKFRLFIERYSYLAPNSLVRAVNKDHTLREMSVYFLGLLLPYLIISALFCFNFYFELKPSSLKIIEKTITIWYFLGSAALFVSVISPIGDLKESSNGYNSEKRMFLGIPSARLMLTTHNAALTMLIEELVATLLFIYFSTALGMYISQGAGTEGFFFIEAELTNSLGTDFLDYKWLLYFLYQATTIISSQGFSGVTPVGGQALAYVVVSIILCGMYIIGLISPIFGMVSSSNKRNSEKYLNNTLVSKVLADSISQLSAQRTSKGFWSGINKSCAVSSACCAIALKRGGLVDKSFEIYQSREEHSHNGTITLSNGLWDIYSASDISWETYSHHLDANEYFLLLCFGASLGYPVIKELETVNGSSANWDEGDGVHWGSYGHIAFSLCNSQKEDQASVCDILRRRQSASGSFYGDTVLTSLVVCFFTYSSLAGSLLQDALQWLASSENEPMQRPFDSVCIWDTAFSLVTLRRYGYNYSDLKLSFEWLVGKYEERYAGWSWSTESKGIKCLDTTTAVLEALDGNDYLDWTLNQMQNQALDEINSLPPTAESNTFQDDYGYHAYCPIIHSRILWLQRTSSATSAGWNKVEAFLGSGNTVVSPWFKDRHITTGLGLYYASKSIVKPTKGMIKIHSQLITDMSKGRIQSPEGKLSALLGVVSVRRNWGINEVEGYGRGSKEFPKWLGTITDLLEDVIRKSYDNSNNKWIPSSVGYFGHGVYYTNEVFITNLACMALMELTEYFGSSR
ncbi:MAG: hypothetical protein K9J17_15985 [Flavobacteriales bacterium]|nr:hypothetical protein [Flavobacteriales bacterium]